jgi:hypothetical protein
MISLFPRCRIRMQSVLLYFTLVAWLNNIDFISQFGISLTQFHCEIISVSPAIRYRHYYFHTTEQHRLAIAYSYNTNNVKMFLILITLFFLISLIYLFQYFLLLGIFPAMIKWLSQPLAMISFSQYSITLAWIYLSSLLLAVLFIWLSRLLRYSGENCFDKNGEFGALFSIFKFRRYSLCGAGSASRSLASPRAVHATWRLTSVVISGLLRCSVISPSFSIGIKRFTKFSHHSMEPRIWQGFHWLLGLSFHMLRVLTGRPWPVLAFRILPSNRFYFRDEFIFHFVHTLSFLFIGDFITSLWILRRMFMNSSRQLTFYRFIKRMSRYASANTISHFASGRIPSPRSPLTPLPQTHAKRDYVTCNL